MAISVLQAGSRGAEVIDLQYLLRFRGGISEVELGTVDGVFGAKTKAAVLKFQKAKGLSPDGVVGQQTWGAIASLKEWPNRVAGEFLRSGNQGEGVKTLQSGLKSKGIFKGALDGVFGPLTKTAVIKIQSSGVPATNTEGIVGPLTFGGAIGD